MTNVELRAVLLLPRVPQRGAALVLHHLHLLVLDHHLDLDQLHTTEAAFFKTTSRIAKVPLTQMGNTAHGASFLELASEFASPTQNAKPQTRSSASMSTWLLKTWI